MGSLRELHGLAARVNTAVAVGDWDALGHCLQERQAVIDRIDGLVGAEEGLTEEDRSEAFTLVCEVVAADGEMAAILEVSLENARSELQGFESTKLSISAYRNTSRHHRGLTQARFVDKQR
jgi:hypothetical protein